MKRSLSLVISMGVTVAAATAGAQTPSFAYSIDAPAALAPGATASITVRCAFTPGVGGVVGTLLGHLPVMGLESGAFSITGNGGTWSHAALIWPVNFILCTPGFIGGPNVVGAVWGTGFVPPAVPSTVNPTPVWRATFTMPASDVTLTLTGNGQHFLWAQHPQFPVTTNGALATGTQVSILVPAPANLSVGAFCVLVAGRRRSRRTNT